MEGSILGFRLTTVRKYRWWALLFELISVKPFKEIYGVLNCYHIKYMSSLEATVFFSAAWFVFQFVVFLTKYKSISVIVFCKGFSRPV
jgi:hypothetical protein